MKKTIKLAGVAMAFIALSTSCEKKKMEVVPSTSNATVTENVITPSAQRSDSRNAVYASSGWCHTTNIVNCTILPEIVVTPTARLIQLTNERDPAVVGRAFSTETALISYLDSFTNADATDLQSGRFVIGLSIQDDRTIAILAGTTYPVTSSNFSFAFQSTK